MILFIFNYINSREHVFLINYYTYNWLSLVLAIYARSPAAFRAVRSLGILELPCTKHLQCIISKTADGPGIQEQYIAHQQNKYEKFSRGQVEAEKKRPQGVGALDFDETKVGKLINN